MECRDFPRDEYEGRWERVQRAMRLEELDAVIATSPGNYRYLTGHRTALWMVPDRVRACVLPATGEPVILLSPAEEGWAKATSWVTAYRYHGWEGFSSWADARAGISEVMQNLSELGLEGKRVGVETGAAQRIGLTFRDTAYLFEQFPAKFVDATDVFWKGRVLKSPREVEAIRESTRILDMAMDAALAELHEGQRESDLLITLENSMRAHGAEGLSFLFVQSDRGDREVLLREVTSRVLASGDLVYLDTGSVYKGYRSDYCRMKVLGKPADRHRQAYADVYQILQDALASVRAGRLVADIVSDVQKSIETRGYGSISELPIRLGHAIGLEMPEPPSVSRLHGHVRIEPGTVLCLEPGVLVDGRYVQLEEMVFVGDGQCELISKPAPPELPGTA